MTLDFSSHEQKPKKRKSLGFILSIGALVGTIALGSTLAASINLNDGGPVEFGQGVTQTTACDDSIKVTPYSSFENRLNNRFVVSGVELSGVDSQNGKCAGKYFEISFYGASSSILGKYVIFDDGSSFSSGNGSISSSGEGSSNSQVTLDIVDGLISSRDVQKITVESKKIENLTNPTITYAADIATSGDSWVKIVICFKNLSSDSYSQNICPKSNGTDLFTKVEIQLPPGVLWRNISATPMIGNPESTFSCLPGSNFNTAISPDQTMLIFDGFSCRLDPSYLLNTFALGGDVYTVGSLSTPLFISPIVTVTRASGLPITANVAANFAFSVEDYLYPNGIPCMAIVDPGTHQCWESVP